MELMHCTVCPVMSKLWLALTPPTYKDCFDLGGWIHMKMVYQLDIGHPTK